MARILVIEDESRIVGFVSRALTAEGFIVDSASDGVRGLELAQAVDYDLILLDLLLPRLDGFSVLRTLMRGRPDRRVVVLSAVNEVDSRVRCLEVGAADYVSKPFALSELLARIHCRLRQPSERQVERVLQSRRVRLELMRRTADAGNGPVRLSEREFQLLQDLMRRQGEVCSRERLLGDVWGYDFDPGTNVVDVYIRRLRAKLGTEVIQTVRNVGYTLEAA
jgi:DNA-binding response OmpR family regulator